MRRSGSEEIGSPSRVRRRAREGFSLPTEPNETAGISLVNSRAEALGYKTRRSPGCFCRALRMGFPAGILVSAYTSKYPIPHPSFVRSPI